MKKIFLTLAACIICCIACTKDPVIMPNSEDNQPTTPAQNTPDKSRYHEIVDLWQIAMRREIPYPFKVYVLKLADGKWFYLRRLNFDGELFIGARTMEYLWAAMTAAAAPEPPAWHGDVLAERRRRVDSGEASFMSVPESKRRLFEEVHAR